MFELRTDVAYHNALEEDERKMLLPMVEIAQMAGAMILRRAPKGIGADGSKFLPYSEPPRANLRAGGKATGQYWAPAGEPQPARNMLYRRGQFAVYPSYKAYKEGMNQHTRTYNKTGTMWRNLRVRAMSPTLVRVAFAGKNKKGLSNAKLAKIITYREPRSILALGGKEQLRLSSFMEEVLPAYYLDALKVTQMSFDAKKKLATAQRKLKKLKRDMELARGSVR